MEKLQSQQPNVNAAELVGPSQLAFPPSLPSLPTCPSLSICPSLPTLLLRYFPTYPPFPAYQATLRGHLAALELALKGKEGELESLMLTLSLKDRTIQELQQELKRLRGERSAAEERARRAEEEKVRLEAELSELQSQGRIHQLSSADLQDRLTRAYADREEMARKLKLAEEALRDKVGGVRGIVSSVRDVVSSVRDMVSGVRVWLPPSLTFAQCQVANLSCVYP